MSTTIQIKNSQVTSQPASLAIGELAYSEVSSTLFVGTSAPAVIAIGGSGVYAKLVSPTFTGSPAGPTPTTSDNSTLLSTTAFVKAQAYAALASPALTGNPTAPTVSTSDNSTNIATTAFVKAQLYLNLAGVQAISLSSMTAPSSSVSWNSQSLTNLAAPVSANDAATKAYVDASSQGLDVKNACMCASTANLTLSGLQTIDGYTTLSADRVLVKAQTTASQNGIYAASSGAWSRTADFNSSANALAGSFTFVENGTVAAGTGWVCNTTGVITVGTTSVSFVQFSGTGSYTAGNGLALTGTSFSVTGTANQITVGGGGVSISSTYIGQTSITTLGTVTTGTISGGTF